jgi:hypothetical protein
MLCKATQPEYCAIQVTSYKELLINNITYVVVNCRITNTVSSIRFKCIVTVPVETEVEIHVIIVLSSSVFHYILLLSNKSPSEHFSSTLD